MIDFRPPPRIKDPALMRILKLELDECELTGETEDLHLHHVIFRSQGGDDLRQNIVCCTEEIHTRYHRHDEDVRRAMAAHVEEKRHDVAAYVFEKLGGPGPLLEWFSRHGIQSGR